MRIAHLTGGIGPEGAGVGKAVAEISRSQAAAGHDVCVFAPSWPERLREANFEWEGALTATFPVVGPIASFGRSPALVGALDDFEPDITHVHGLWMWHNAAALSWHRRCGQPYVISPHGMLSPVALAFSHSKKRLARWLFQDRVLNTAAAIHVTSATEAAEVRAFGLQNHIEVVPLPISGGAMDRQRQRQRGTSRTILFLGRLHPQKGIDRLIDAWKLLEDDFPAWRIDVVGPHEGGYAQELQSQVRRLGLKRVSFFPPKYGAEREACMIEAELFVLPSLGENFALTIAESLIAGVPVIASRRAPWPGLIEHRCGWWVEPDVVSIASAIREAITLNPAARREMGQRGRDWVSQQFSCDAVVEKFLSLYGRVLA